MLPPALLQSLQSLPGLDLQAFQRVHEENAAPVTVRLNPKKARDGILPFHAAGQVPWCSSAFYLPQRPQFAMDPFWHAGVYYVQEASSMILEEVWKQCVPAERPGWKLLDLCAAPGGKSTHLLSLMRPDDILVSNEVIGSRVNILVENITRWGYSNSIVSNNDPQDFEQLQGYFDMLVVDAPCSGSGLFRRDPAAVQEWSEQAVTVCRKRQQRILADVWPALKEEGLLVYTTCSYSPEEDEEVVDWLSSQYDIEPVVISLPDHWQIVKGKSASQPSYRFFPHLVQGEGFFLAVFRKKAVAPLGRNKSKPAARMEIPVAALQQQWVNPGIPLDWYRHKDTLYAMAENMLEVFLTLNQHLRVRKAGICLGEWQRNGLQPDHALAMSSLLHPDVGKLQLDLQDALTYLRKENLSVAAGKTGWQVAVFEGISLGWLKHLGTRINNYYPREWRLRS